MTPNDRARALRDLHFAPEILTLVNVWDVASARIVAANPATRAIATASYAVAAAHGYADDLPGDDMLAAAGDIAGDIAGGVAADTDLPVTADLQSGYGDVGDTIRRAIHEGVVGANIEDENRPFDDAVRSMEQAMAAADAEGVGDFVLNARTDAFWHGTGRPASERVDDAIARGRAFIDAGATCVFVPGVTDESIIGDVVAGIGERRFSLMASSDSPSPRHLQDLGVARVSVGPWAMFVAYAALADLTTTLASGDGLPADARPVT